MVAPVVVVAAGLAGGCSDGDPGGDLEAFCGAIEELRDDDPFAELAVASPGEMRDAFEQLRAGAERVESAAPTEAEVQARAYLESVDRLIDLMRAAGYDPRSLDNLAYSDATSTYTSAAVSVDRAATAACPA